MSDNMPFSEIGYLTVSKELEVKGDTSTKGDIEISSSSNNFAFNLTAKEDSLLKLQSKNVGTGGDYTDGVEFHWNGQIKNVSSPTDPKDAATKSYVDSQQGGSGGTNQNLTQVLAVGNSAGNNKITDVNDPTNDQDVATKAYVDSQSGGGGSSQNLSQVLTVGNDAGNQQIKNLSQPSDSTDAATKSYVDNASNKNLTQVFKSRK